MTMSSPSIPPVAKQLYSHVYKGMTMPANAVMVDAKLAVDCTTGWVVGHDSDGNLICGKLAVFERANNPTLPMQTALRTWVV